MLESKKLGMSMSSKKGKPLTPEVKKRVVSVKEYFDRSKLEKKLQGNSSTKQTADALGIGEASVKRIMADYNRSPDWLDAPPKTRGHRCHSISTSYQEMVRQYIRIANQNGEYITLEDIKTFLQEKSVEKSFHIITLGRTLNRWGFEFGRGTRSQHLKEKDHVIVARQRYLRKKRENRLPYGQTETIREEVYLDESYINKNHSNDFIWYSSTDGPWVQKPTGSVERLIILNAITKSGWVPSAKLVFKSTRKTGDYHGQMNWNLFSKWFSEMLLPNIPENSLIIMDNVSYHNILSEHSPPTASCSKSKICTWFTQQNIPFEPDFLKPELVDILNRQAPEPIDILDEIAKEQGHEIIRTPPYHPELQPIEMCWGIVKNHVARNSDFTMDNLYTQLDIGFEQVTAKTCIEVIAKVRKKEDEFWIADSKLDTEN